MGTVTPLAARGIGQPPPWDWEMIGLAGLLAVLFGAGALAIHWAKNWRRPPEPPVPENPIDTYQAMLERGELDPEEFARIRARLQRRGHPEVPPPPDPTARKPGLPPLDGPEGRPPS